MSLVQAKAWSGSEFLTSRQVATRLSISVRTLWRMLKQGKVPEPIRFSRKLVRWRADDVEKYIQSLSPRVEEVA